MIHHFSSKIIVISYIDDIIHCILYKPYTFKSRKNQSYTLLFHQCYVSLTTPRIGVQMRYYVRMITHFQATLYCIL